MTANFSPLYEKFDTTELASQNGQGNSQKDLPWKDMLPEDLLSLRPAKFLLMVGQREYPLQMTLMVDFPCKKCAPALQSLWLPILHLFQLYNILLIYTSSQYAKFSHATDLYSGIVV